MARFDKLLQCFGMLGNYRSVLTNRISLVNQQQVATLKAATINKLKNLKIPEPPKRPLPPYIKYITEHRLELVKQHPGLTVVELTKRCAEDWRKFDETQKKKITDEYHKELQIYMQQKQAYDETLTLEQVDALKDAMSEKRVDKKRRATRKLERQYEKPKRPLGNFLYFMKEKLLLSENKGKRYTDLLKVYRGEWNTLPEEKKKPYTTLWENDKARYKREMEIWEAKMIKEGNADLIRKTSRVVTAKPTSVPRSKKQDPH